MLPWIDARLVCRAGLRGLIKEDLQPHDDGFEDGLAGRRSTGLQASVVLGGFDLRLWSSVDWETWVRGMAVGRGTSGGGWRMGERSTAADLCSPAVGAA